MTRLLQFILACLLLSCLTAHAQWPPYPTPDVPLTADGKPDLDAPPPKTPWGDPDLSGIWERYGGFGGPADEEEPADPGAPPQATFFDLGANMENGLPYTDWARELKAARMADNMKDNPDAHCLPIGYMQLHQHPQPHKIIQTQDLIVMIWESNGGLRQIFLDGRELPDDALPWWYGYSVGHWEGDTLVVESNGFRDDVWLDVNGSPLTSGGKIIERYTRDSFGHMIVDVTIEDPMSYTEPFTVRVEHGIMLDTNLIEFICNENEMSSQFFDP
jgi:hypothetical protein